MAEHVRVASATLTEIQSELGHGRQALEDTAASAPTAIDGGDMTSMLAAMMSKLIDQSAAVSAGLSVTSSQVAEVGASFWETDSATASTFTGDHRAN